MLPLEFILTDAHFVIGLLAALACFATCWLYLDAWLAKGKAWKEFLKWFGYGVLAVGFVVTATEVEPAFLGQTLFGQIGLVAMILRGLGYGILAVGLALDPLQPIPVIKDLVDDAKKADEAATGGGDGGAPAAAAAAPVVTPAPAVVMPAGTKADTSGPDAKGVPASDVAPSAGEVAALATAAPAPSTAPAVLSAAPAVATGGAAVAGTEPAGEQAAAAPQSKPTPPEGTMAAGGAMIGWGMAQVLLPLLAGSAAFLYVRRATKGLERHLKPVAWAFGWFTLFELLDLAILGRGTDDPRLYGVVAPFGPMWIMAHVVLAVAGVVLGLWVWQYLTKRLQTQLFMVLTSACLVIFLVTTVSFTFLLMSRVQSQAFASLDTTAKVLGTSIAGQQAKTAADADVVAENPTIVTAVVARDHQRLVQLTKDFLPDRRQSSLVITTDSGQVLLRAEDPASWGDSVSSDSQVARAIVGKSTNGLVSSDGALAPRLMMRATAPMRNAAGTIVGTVTVSFTVDNAFVDGLKQTTGLASAMYGGSVRVATTLLAPDGSSRALGVKETRTDITSTVLEHNKTWSGLVKTGGQTYLAVYSPLRDVDNVPVGMLFIGQPQVLLLQAAGRSIELTFLVAVFLLLAAVAPVHLLSRSLAQQLR